MPLGREQLALAVEPAGIAAERPVAADHAVARDQHRDMIVAIGRADRADRLGLADRRGDLRIAAGLAGGNLAKLAPDRFLEGGAGDVDRQVARRERSLDRHERAFDQVAEPAVILDDRSPSGTAAGSEASLSSNVSRQMPLDVAAISIWPSGLSKCVQRMVSPRPPSRHADGVMPSLSFASL